MVNIELLQEVVDWAEAESFKPDGGEWNQGHYFCGTACCIAGKVVLMHGYEQTPLYSAWVVWREGCPLEADYQGDVSVPHLAQELLGLSETRANELFSGGNTLDDVKRIAKDIMNETEAS